MSRAYRRRDYRTPRVTGLPLRALVKAAEAPLSGPILQSIMLSQLGIEDLRKLTIDDPLPIHAPLPRYSNQTSLIPLTEWPEPGSSAPFLGVADILEAYKSKKSSPTQIVESFLKGWMKSERGEAPLRAFISQDPIDLREQAEASEARWQKGKPLSLLDGIPIAIKDEIDQAPYPTSVGTRFLGRSPAAADATVVARLRAAGALLIGKANMHEIGIGVTGLNPHHGAARNPYDRARAPGGSSSGSAVAVAAGLCPLAIGADGGGSVRIPAGLCGQFGLKATHGRVSEHGAAPLCWSVAHIGPIANNARDLALLYAAIAGPDPLDSLSLSQGPLTLPRKALAQTDKLRIGIDEDWFADSDPAMQARARELLQKWTEAGQVELVPIEIPDLEFANLAHAVIISTEMAASQTRYQKDFGSFYGADVRLNLQLARGLTAIDYLQASRLRAALSRQLEAIFKTVDLIASPMTSCVAPLYGADALPAGVSDLGLLEKVLRFAPLANLTGLPAIAIPSGTDEQGLPTSLQLIAPPWREDRLLESALQTEIFVERRAPADYWNLIS